MIPGITSVIYFTSSSVLSSQSESRKDPCATSCGRPMASNTCDGSREPEVHAEPEEAQTSLSSSKSNRLSPSTPSKQKLTFPGRRFSFVPFSAPCGIFSSPAISSSRNFNSFFVFDSILSHASFSAAAIPHAAPTFSVPARLPLSCAPPSINGCKNTPRRQYNAPIPFGP